MTDRDLAICRDWCRANGMEIIRLWGPDGPYSHRTGGEIRNACLTPLVRDTVENLYAAIWC